MYEDEFDTEEEIEPEKEGIFNKVLRIILAILLIILIILLMVKCTRDNKDNSFDKNITTIRLASEKYYFIDGNYKDEYIKTSLNELKNKGYINSIKDSDNNDCDMTNSIVFMDKDTSNYVMEVKLICPKKSDSKIFYYSIVDKTCNNCNGNTYMDGSPESTYGLSCTNFSEYSKNRINDSRLEERVKTMVIAYKPGYTDTEVTYSNWSDWSNTKIDATNTLEVDTKVVKIDNWSGELTTTVKPIESDTLKIIGTSTSTSTGSCNSYGVRLVCPNGYKEDNNGNCYKNSTVLRTYTQYYNLSTSEKRKCTMTNDKKYSCSVYSYKDKIESTVCTGYSTITTTVYTYMENHVENKTQYRSRTKTVHTVSIPDNYTDLIEKKDVPSGYKIKSGSEVNYYSYKVKVCSK